MRFTGNVAGTALVFALAIQNAAGQTQPNAELRQVRQEMEQLKQEYEQLSQGYEQRLKQLDDRLKQLEGASIEIASVSAQPPVATRPAPNPAPQAVANGAAQAPPAQEDQANQAQQPFQQDTESINLALAAQEDARVRERMERVMREYLDIGGYFRSGYGKDNDGGPQVAFQAPGAMAKGRLGNEAENYGELIIGKNFYLPGAFSLSRNAAGGTNSTPVARFQTRISIYNPYSNYQVSSSTEFGLPEAWVAIGNIIPGQPSMNFWAGSRFYRRHDMHIDDFFLHNMSGGGGGVEDINTPIGKFAVAWIGIGSQSAFTSVPQPDPLNKAGFNKTNFDFRFYDFNLPGGKGEIAVDVSHATSGKDQLGNSAPNSTGASVTFIHTSEKWLGENNLNKFYIQYGHGPAKTFTSGFETFSSNGGTYIRPDAPGSYRFRVAENLIYETGNHFSISPVVLYQRTDYKQYGGVQDWFSAGVRPQAHFNKYVSLAFEPFVDWTDDKSTNISDYLFKVTMAPQISLGSNFMSRPVVRTFVTYAHWGNGFVGKIGGPDYSTSNEGVTWGVQVESWW